MPYLRLSSARSIYICIGCTKQISIGEKYFRDEPHPMARRHRGVQVRHLCLVCVIGERRASELFAGQFDLPQLQAQFDFSLSPTEDGQLLVPPRVELIDITPHLVKTLAQEPERLYELAPDSFEALICNRLDRLGYNFERVGSSTFRKDGGIDIIACPRSSPVPFLLAVQVKHTRMPNRRIGPPPIRELLGSVETHGFNAGLVVTNTTFTPDAQWVAQRKPLLLQLRDGEDLKRWLRDDFLQKQEWRAIPTEIEICPGVIVKVPR